MGNHVCNGVPNGPTQNVKAGLQRVVQMFITNSANVFLLDLVPVPGRENEHGVQLTAQVWGSLWCTANCAGMGLIMVYS